MEKSDLDESFEKYITQVEREFLVLIFFHWILIIGAIVEFGGVALLALNSFLAAKISREILAAPLIVGFFLILFGWLGREVNKAIKICVFWDDDCPICRR
jgi:hypothetical protein